MFDLIIFDCDGVLVDSEPLVNRVYVDLLAEHGYAINYEECLREFSGAAMATRLQAFSQRLDWSPPAAFPEIFQERLYAIMERRLVAVTGIQTVLSGLQVPFCVASNGSLNEITFRLKTCRLEEYFGKALFSGTEVPRPKPHPDVFLAAAAAFGVDPLRCAVIEDSVVGVRAGVSAGMTVFGYAAQIEAAILKAAGATIFSSMTELPALLCNGAKVTHRSLP